MWLWSPAGSIPQLRFAEDISADEDSQALSQGRYKKKGNKLLEKTNVERQKGNKVSPAEEAEREGRVQKRRRRKKKSPLPPERFGSGGRAVPPERNGGSEPDAGSGRAQKPGAVVLGAAAPCPQELSRWGHPSTHSRRKRPRKRSPRGQGESAESAASPLEDSSQGGPDGGHAQALAPQAPPAGGAPALKRKRKLGAPLVNGGGPPTPAWPPPQQEGPPASPADGEACPTPLPQSGRLKKKAGAGSLELHDPSTQKAAIFKKRKKMKEMLDLNLVERSRVLESELTLVQALGSPGALSPLKKKLRAEDDFVKFDTPFLPKPVFFRKAKSSAAAPAGGPPAQVSKTPPGSKKVTFGLSRNMTAEFKKTDKSILVSPTGPSRVAFNPEQKPLHGVLKTPTSSPISTLLGTKKPLTTAPRRRPTAMDFF